MDVVKLFRSACVGLGCVVFLLALEGCSSHSEPAKNQTVQPLAQSSEAPISPSQTAIPAPQSTAAPVPTPNVTMKEVQTDAAAPNPTKVKGIYVSAWSAAGSKFEQLLNLVDKTDLNAMVIDVKNDSGQVTHPSQVPLVNEIGANSNVIIKDMRAKLQSLKDKNIYTIARIVVFKDPYLSKKKSEYAMKSKSGGTWKDNKGVAWVDPYKEEVWNYNLAIAKEAASLGFDEIQFDYIRFPDNGKRVDREVRFDNPNGWTKAEAVEAFLKRAKEQLGNTPISADVFGLTTSSDDDMGIGQEWTRISKYVNVISPMLYPSHYSSGVYGVKKPDLQPYAIIHRAVGDAIAKNDKLKQNGSPVAEVRPWYQDFTATWVKPHKTYGAEDVREQIKAAKEHGVEQFILWNSNSAYSYR